MKSRKRMSIWTMDNSVMIEDGNKEARGYHNITPSSWDRIEKLSFHAYKNNLTILLHCFDDGLAFVAIDRR